jgi:hypothetical protein
VICFATEACQDGCRMPFHEFELRKRGPSSFPTSLLQSGLLQTCEHNMAIFVGNSLQQRCWKHLLFRFGGLTRANNLFPCTGRLKWLDRRFVDDWCRRGLVDKDCEVMGHPAWAMQSDFSSCSCSHAVVVVAVPVDNDSFGEMLSSPSPLARNLSE